jgi:hypothetical protein
LLTCQSTPTRAGASAQFDFKYCLPSDPTAPCPSGFTYAQATSSTGAVIVYCTATSTPISADQLAQAPPCFPAPPPTVVAVDICGPGDVYRPLSKPLICPDGNVPPSGSDLCPSTATSPASAPGCFDPAYPTVLSSVTFGPACFAPAPGYGCAAPSSLSWWAPSSASRLQHRLPANPPGPHDGQRR